ncbi:MAG: hypothetical protein A3J69_00580 [Candidatus Levybacteria bacterium RIFCSPHIGHO2_02_FULL_42_12]|nr:MAG: hypothetical protein A2698_00300 [Candidatus Levybacteria bacterium RIFCSPHIGHO2_01_FULL_42_15]OGH30875.1 MAG: hypothetical protein A3J69_00580 [Candidatus Levybacteria bacterium RIFCSPHIGHO2_02_FULL_42_12]OGH42116.1 MAG: hypothetical protein A3B53_00890 [Candidatus Levybacteria bacterium RIFCSPLOWO2_01_FULL_42_15]
MKGQTLIEVLVALGISGIIIAAIVTLVTVSLQSAQFTKEQHLATEYAQEGMEEMRTLRDTQWATFLSYVPSSGSLRSFCLDQNTRTLRNASSCGQNLGTFVRKVEFQKDVDPCIGNAAKVNVYVLWRDSKCQQTGISDEFALYCHQVKLSSCFSNTNVLPTP